MGETLDARDVLSADFQMWDYSPSHRRLMFRSPPASDHDYNIDLVFTGVRGMWIPTALQSLSTQEPLTCVGVVDLGDEVTKYFINSREDHYFVIAEFYDISKNYSELYEAISDATESLRVKHAAYEIAVADVLGRTFRVQPALHPNREPDLELTDQQGRKLLVEVKRRDVGKSSHVVRQLAMSLVHLGKSVTTQDAGLLVVLGGQPPEIAGELTAALRTALGTYRVKAVTWEPGGSAFELENSARELLNL